jgi:hypothetical protein
MEVSGQIHGQAKKRESVTELKTGKGIYTRALCPKNEGYVKN